MAYEVVAPRMAAAEQFAALEEAGFETAWHATLAELDDAALAALFATRRA